MNSTSVAPQVDEVFAAEFSLRAVLAANAPPVECVAAAIVATCCQLGSIEHPRGCAAVTAIAARWGWSALSLPLDRVCAPWSEFDRVLAFARTLRARRELIGFIMPANLPGAGLHEVAAAILAGCAVIIKTAAAEPIFFAEFARALAEVDAAVGARIAVFSWGRKQTDLTKAMSARCDRIVAFGDDGTIAQLEPARASGLGQPDRGLSRFVGFGARVSGIVVTAGAIGGAGRDALAETIAKEVSVFEQRGCLSPHHLFVGETDGLATRDFAEEIAAALERLARGPLPPPRALALEDAIAIRRVREAARWRALSEQSVRLWEGALPGWTIVYDRDAAFTGGPGFRTLTISPFFDPADLARRLAPVTGRVEAMGVKFSTADSRDYLAELREVIGRTGASWICEPERMQSPPADWPHGGGEFLRMLRAS
ncbi:MAG TPA: acyl-CoA reductase [Candidatus Binataceae bacterium]|nr:acyl-CoA reductase [Candidatus Binataceae bacterium]